MGRRGLVALAAGALAAGVVPGTLPGASAGTGTGGSGDVGFFEPLFQEPDNEAVQECVDAQEIGKECTPAAMALASLPNGEFFFYDGLEGMNDVQLNTVAEFGDAAKNDLSRVLDLNGTDGAGATFTAPTPVTGGANPNGNENTYLPFIPHNNDNIDNDGDLFCSALTYLADGRILVVGGTSYYQEPNFTPDGEIGVVELEGLKNTRTFNANDNTFSQTADMNYGRWYPTAVTLGDGSIFVASGVTKLVKPVYTGDPDDPDALGPADSGTNVKQTEVYDPEADTWTTNPDSADNSLPLYPRMFTLPNGNVYYDAGGQTFNPFGQSYDEATWNLSSVYDVESQSWTDMGVPVIGVSPSDVPTSGTPLDDIAPAAPDEARVDVPAGFRGSASHTQLRLEPDQAGEYTEAEFLAAGGVFGVSPGSYFATGSSTINRVDLATGDEVFTSRSTGPLAQPRWYGTQVALSNGEVLTFSGANRDEVVNPGTGTPIKTVELFDPETETWRELAEQQRGRTYHNTAVLMQDGRVLVGGHAPIANSYAFQTDVGTDTAGLSRSTSDPSFEIFSPPYLRYGPRPAITEAPGSAQRGDTVTVGTPDAREISSVVMVRNNALTHLVGGDQRTVSVPFTVTDDDTLSVTLPDNGAVLPDGPYQMFIHKEYEQGETPSTAAQVFVGDGPMEGLVSAPAPVVPEVPQSVILPLAAGFLLAGAGGVAVYRRRQEVAGA